MRINAKLIFTSIINSKNNKEILAIIKKLKN